MIPQTPYSSEINRLKQRISKPGQQQGAQSHLQKLKAKAWFADRNQWQQQQQNTPNPVPFSGVSEAQIAAARNVRNQTLTDLSGRELATQQSYGITDQSNPYAQARLLEQNYQRGQQGTLTNYAGQGQLYSGSLQNAVEANRQGFGQSEDEMLRAYQAALAQISSGRVEAQNTYASAEAEAQARALEDALNQPVDPTTAPSMAKPPWLKDYLRGLKKGGKKGPKGPDHGGGGNGPHGGGGPHRH